MILEFQNKERIGFLNIRRAFYAAMTIPWTAVPLVPEHTLRHVVAVALLPGVNRITNCG